MVPVIVFSPHPDIYLKIRSSIMKNIKSIYFLRNGSVCEDHASAIMLLNSKSSELNDGEAVLVRYRIENGSVKTLVGYKYKSEEEDSMTIVDTDSIEASIQSVIGSVDVHTADTSAHVSENDRDAWDAKVDTDQIPDVSGYIDGAEYESDGVNHSIVFYHGTTMVDSIDATPFLKDGMVQDVRIEDDNLVIDFNTESGIADIAIPLTDIFNPDQYYTRYDVDLMVQEKETEITKTNTEVYNLKKVVGDMGGNVVYDYPGEGKTFNTLMGNNGTVKLSEDASTGRYGPGITAKNNTTLNLNTHNLTFTGLTSDNSAIMARGTQVLTITGKGTINSGEAIAVTCNSANATINLSGTTSTVYQANRPDAELIYCFTGTINISNGTFRNEGSPYLLNCYDANYKNGTAKIIVTGGRFYDFDPGNNSAEGPGTSFLAQGYHTEATTVTEEGVEHTLYTVKKDS